MSRHIEQSDYRRMYEVEDAHWWFDGMETISARLLDTLKFTSAAGDGDGGGSGGHAVHRALDAGCGTGRTLGFLRRRFPGCQVTGLDTSAFALNCCVERGFGGHVAAGTLLALPFADDSFDLVTCFDVLTTAGVHDRAALGEIARVLRPGGGLLLRAAAYDWLRGGRHDQQWAIVHRYGRRELREKLAGAGFQVLRASYANMWLLPLVMFKRLSERLLPAAANASHSELHAAAGRSWTGKWLRRLLESEARWVAGGHGGLPCGVSLFALARKPAAPPPAMKAG